MCFRDSLHQRNVKYNVDDSENTQISKKMTAVSNVEGDKENICQQSDAMPIAPSATFTKTAYT